jgi:hypothetical protein
LEGPPRLCGNFDSLEVREAVKDVKLPHTESVTDHSFWAFVGFSVMAGSSVGLASLNVLWGWAAFVSLVAIRYTVRDACLQARLNFELIMAEIKIQSEKQP